VWAELVVRGVRAAPQVFVDFACRRPDRVAVIGLRQVFDVDRAKANLSSLAHAPRAGRDGRPGWPWGGAGLTQLQEHWTRSTAESP
jgi:hypothetical protein